MNEQSKPKIADKNKLISNTILSSISELSLFFTSVFYILAARFLGDEVWGQMATALNFVGLFIVLVIFGFMYSIPKIIVRDRSVSGKYIYNALYIQIGFAALCYVACLVTAHLVNYPPIVLFLITVIFLAETLKCFNLTMRASHKALGVYKYDTLAMNIERILLLFVGGGLLILGKGIITIVFVYLGVRIISFLIMLWFTFLLVDKKFYFINFSLVKELLFSSWIYVLQAAFLRVYDHVDSVIVSLLCKAEEVGWYTAGRKILEGLWLIPNIVTEAIYPEISARNLVSQDAVYSLFSKAIKYMLIISIWVSFGTIVLSRFVVDIVYGPEYVNTAKVLVVLGIGVVPSYLRYICGNALIATNHEKLVLYFSAVRSAFCVGLNIYFIQLYGYLGAAIATMLTDFLAFLLYLIALYKFDYVKKDQLGFWIKSFVGMGLALLFLLAPWHDVLVFSAMTITYFTSIYLLRILDKEEQTTLVKYVAAKISKR